MTLAIPPSPSVRVARAVDAKVRAAARDGRLERLRCGSYVDSIAWRGLDRDVRTRAFVFEAARRRPRPLLVSHVSAAALWGLPLVGRRIDAVDSLRFTVSGGRSEATLRAHRSSLRCQPDVIDGVEVTPLARTLVDVARTESLVTSVCALDAALVAGLVTRGEVLAELGRHGRARGCARAREALAVASPGSTTPLESLSCVRMHEARLERPEQQVELPAIEPGASFFVDFAWSAHRLLGEADGDGKYGSDVPTSVAAVLAEKDRENHLRGLGHDMVRWDWETAWRPAGLEHRLLRRGVRVLGPWA